MKKKKKKIMTDPQPKIVKGSALFICAKDCVNILPNTTTFYLTLFLFTITTKNNIYSFMYRNKKYMLDQ